MPQPPRQRKPTTLADPRVNSKISLAFGRWLRRRRGSLERGTLRMLSNRSGLALGTLSEIERGYVDPLDLSVRTLARLSEAYRVQITALLGRMGLAPAPSPVDAVPEQVPAQDPLEKKR